MSNPDRLLARVTPLDIKGYDALLVALVSFLIIVAAWASFAEIEEQVRATGTIIASSRSQVVQSVDGGSLKALHVKEGDIVNEGDLIAELDPVRFQASNDEIAAKMAALQASIIRLEAEISNRRLVFPEALLAYPEIIQTQRDLHTKRLQAQSQELSAINNSVVLAKEELSALDMLYESGDAAFAEVLKSRRQVNELQAQGTNKSNAFLQEAQQELAKTRAEYEQTQQVLTQRSTALESTFLKAPMSGTVKNVRFTTRGAVLREGDELLQIVPSDDPLVIEARVRPADVAFVRQGLEANVKLDAYDYTLYGALRGKVIYVSPDTLEEDLQRDETPYYRVHIQTDSNAPKGRKPLDVRPGMTATVEIITGKRTIANFIIKPLRRTVDNAFHEK